MQVADNEHNGINDMYSIEYTHREDWNGWKKLLEICGDKWGKMEEKTVSCSSFLNRC
jgi:hypothetical protein